MNDLFACAKVINLWKLILICVELENMDGGDLVNSEL